jgi:signal transduction histidine kinase
MVQRCYSSEFIQKAVDTIMEKWGKVPKKQIVKELNTSLATVNEIAEQMIYGYWGEDNILPETDKYGPKDPRVQVKIKIGKKDWTFTVPDREWPVKKDDIKSELYTRLKDALSETIYSGMFIHHAKERNLRNKAKFWKEWVKAYNALVKLRELAKQ